MLYFNFWRQIYSEMTVDKLYEHFIILNPVMDDIVKRNGVNYLLTPILQNVKV